MNDWLEKLDEIGPCHLDALVEHKISAPDSALETEEYGYLCGFIDASLGEY